MDSGSARKGARLNRFWTLDKEAQLIALYRDNSILWDIRHPEYYKKDKRDLTLTAIANCFDEKFTVLAIKEKIKSLRDYFVKELKKEWWSQNSSHPYVSRWEHFDSWAFLRRVVNMEPRKEEQPAASLPVGEHTEEQHDRNGEASDSLGGQASGVQGPPAAMPAGYGVANISTGAETGHPAGTQNGGGLVVEKSEPDDEDLVFVRGLMNELSEMDRYQRDLAKVRIQMLLFEGKYGTTEDVRDPRWI